MEERRFSAALPSTKNSGASAPWLVLSSDPSDRNHTPPRTPKSTHPEPVSPTHLNPIKKASPHRLAFSTNLNNQIVTAAVSDVVAPFAGTILVSSGDRDAVLSGRTLVPVVAVTE